MNIVCTFDNNYTKYAAVMLNSLLHHNTEVNIFCVTDYISEENKIELFKLMDISSKSQIEIVNISADFFRKFELGSDFEQLSVAAYYRLLLPQIIPAHIDKIIYLDCDIIVNNSLVDLWDIDVTEIAVAAIEDKFEMTLLGPKRLNYPKEYSYFNSGVMLLNLKYLRKINFTILAQEYLITNSDRIIFHDQDVLNGLLHDQKRLIDSKWNCMDFMYIKGYDLDRQNISRKILKAPNIIHFSGLIKPWNNESAHPFKYIFWKYANALSFKNLELVHRYTGKRLIQFILREKAKQLLNLIGKGKKSFYNSKELAAM